MVQKIEMCFPKTGKLVRRIEMKKIETGDMSVGELVKKIQANESRVGKVGRPARCGQEECMEPEQDAMLAETGEENEFIKCFDDITGKELLWQALKEAREKEVKYLRELGVCENFDQRAVVAKYNITPVDTMWVDTDKAFEEKPMQIRSRIVARVFKSAHVDVSRAYFHAKAQRFVLVKVPAQGCSGKDVGKIGLLQKSMYGTRDAASNWESPWQGHLEKWVMSWGAVPETCSTTRKRKLQA